MLKNQLQQRRDGGVRCGKEAHNFGLGLCYQHSCERRRRDHPCGLSSASHESQYEDFPPHNSLQIRTEEEEEVAESVFLSSSSSNEL